MGNAVVRSKFDALRVDHDETNFIGRGAHKNGHDHRIDRDRLTRTRGAADKQVRHLREIDDDRMALDIFANSHFKRRAMGVFEHVAQKHVLSRAVRHLDANMVRSRNRRKNAHAGRRKCQSDVVGQAHNAAYAYARGQIDLEQRDRGTSNPADNLRHDAEIFERILQFCGERAKLSLVGFGSDFSMVNEAKRRQGEITARLPFFIECGIVDLLGLGRGRRARFRRTGCSGNIAQATRHRLFGSAHVRISPRSVIGRRSVVFPRKGFTLRFQHARLRGRIRRVAFDLLFLLVKCRFYAKKLGDGFVLDITEGIASALNRVRSTHARSGTSSPHHGPRSGARTIFGGAKSIFSWPIGIDRWGGNLARTAAFEQLRRERLRCTARARKVARNVHGLGTTNACWRHFSLSLLRSLRSSGGLTLFFRHAKAGKQTALFATRGARFGRLDLSLGTIFIKRGIGIIVRIDRFIRNAR